MSPPRKFSGKVKPGMGDSGTEGEDFTKKHRTNPWDSNPRGDFISRDGGRYTNNESGLRNKPEGSGTGDKHDIWSDVSKNSDDVSETGGTGPIRYGTDK